MRSLIQSSILWGRKGILLISVKLQSRKNMTSQIPHKQLEKKWWRTLYFRRNIKCHLRLEANRYQANSIYQVSCWWDVLWATANTRSFSKPVHIFFISTSSFRSRDSYVTNSQDSDVSWRSEMKKKYWKSKINSPTENLFLARRCQVCMCKCGKRACSRRWNQQRYQEMCSWVQKKPKTTSAATSNKF